MLRDILSRLKDEDCSKMTLEQLRALAGELRRELPQGPVRRGVVAHLGEVWACKLLGLIRMPQGHAGYDALDPRGRIGPAGSKYQIKTRSPEKGRLVNEAGTVGRFTSFDFDRAIMVLIDDSLQAYEIWVAEQEAVQNNLRSQRNDIRVSHFKRIGKCLYPYSR